MSRKITVIIQKAHKTLGKKNSIVSVSQGYALNYLIPNQLAKIASEGQLKHLKMIHRIEKSKLANAEYKNSILQQNLEKILKISIKKKLGEKQQIFGRISEKEIITILLEYTGAIIEKKQIYLPSIKALGTYNIRIEISQNRYTNFRLQILPENININL